MNAIWALALKDLKLLLRDKGGFFFTFIFPIAFALFFGSIFGGSGGGGGEGSPGIRVVLIDDDNTEASRAFVKTLSGATELDPHVSTDLKAAEGEVTGGKSVALIRLMKGYGAGQENLFWRGGEQSTIEVAVDPSKKAEAGMLQGVLQKYAFSGMGKAFTDPTVNRKQISSARKQIDASKDISTQDRLMFNTFFGAMDTFMGGMDRRSKEEAAKPDGTNDKGGFAFEPVKIVARDLVRERNGPTNAFTISFPQGIMWGVMGAALGFAASLLSEKSGGTFGRLAASPLPVWGVLAGKGLACFITMLGVTTIMIIVAVFVCRVTIANPVLLVAGVLSVSLGFVGIMTLIATLAKSERAAQGGGWGVMMVFAFIGGAAVPSFAMPSWMQHVSQVSPMYWAIRLFEGGLWRPLSTADAAVAIAVMLGIAIVGFSLGAASMRRA
jgi:ABC-2 type transport system permease protein